MANFRKVAPGDRLTIDAAEYNAMLDAAQAHKKPRNFDPRRVAGVSWGQMCLVRNESGVDVPRYGVLGIGEPIVKPTDNEYEFLSRLALKGALPTADHLGHFVITAEPIPVDGIGQAWIDGVCLVHLDVTSEDLTTADCIAGDVEKLGTVADGAWRVLWHEPGTGVKWAIVKRGYTGDTSFLAQITAYEPDDPESGLPPVWQWKYKVKRVTKTLPGYNHWELDDEEIEDVRNYYEDKNATQNVLGNGVQKVSVGPNDGFLLQPIPIGVLVRVRRVSFTYVDEQEAEQSVTEYWFHAMNGIDGECV